MPFNYSHAVEKLTDVLKCLATHPGDVRQRVAAACFWEDDGQDDHDADEVRGGPNADLSLAQGRRNYQEFGASDRRRLQHVRKPKTDEL
jgi:hypothetical protein